MCVSGTEQDMDVPISCEYDRCVISDIVSLFREPYLKEVDDARTHWTRTSVERLKMFKVQALA